MDKQDYREIIRGIKTGFEEKDYSKVIAFAREISLRKIKEVSVLEMVADSYMKLKKPQAAKEALEIAYSKNPNGKYIVHKLAMLSIKSRDIDSAVQYYEDFCRIAPNDNQRLIVKYKIAKAGGLSNQDKIKILEEYCSKETDDKWMFELAELYHEVGDGDKCASMCDEIILWFGESDYLKKALELKFAHKALSPNQQALYEKIMHEYIGGYSEPESEPEMIPEADPVPTALDEEAEEFASRYLKAKGKKEFIGKTKPIDISGKIEGRSNEVMWDIPSTVQIGAIAGNVAQAVKPELEEADKAFITERLLKEKTAEEKTAEENEIPEEIPSEEENPVSEEPVLSAVNMFKKEDIPSADGDYEKRMIVADDGQLELDLDLLGADYQESHKNLSLEQMFKTYKNNIENNDSNKEAVAKVEAERLRQIQEAVANMMPEGPKFVSEDEQEEDLTKEEALKEEKAIENSLDEFLSDEEPAETASEPIVEETVSESEPAEETEKAAESVENTETEIETQSDEDSHLELDDDIAAQIIAKVLGASKTKDEPIQEEADSSKNTLNGVEEDYDYDEDTDSGLEEEEEVRAIPQVVAGAAAGIKDLFKKRKAEDTEDDFEDEYDNSYEDDENISGQMEIPDFVKSWKKRHASKDQDAETTAENEVPESEFEEPLDATSEDVNDAINAFKDYDEDYDYDEDDNGLEDNNRDATKVIPPVVASAAAVGAGIKDLFKKHKDENLEEDFKDDYEDALESDSENNNENAVEQVEIPEFVKEWKKRHARDKQEDEEVAENKAAAPKKKEHKEKAVEKTEVVYVAAEIPQPSENKSAESVKMKKKADKEELPQTGKIKIEIPEFLKKSAESKAAKEQAAAAAVNPDIKKADEKEMADLDSLSDFFTAGFMAGAMGSNEEAAPETAEAENELKDLDSLTDFFADFTVKEEEPQAEEPVAETATEETVVETKPEEPKVEAGTEEPVAEPEAAEPEDELKDLDALADFFADFTAKEEKPQPEEAVAEAEAEEQETVETEDELKDLDSLTDFFADFTVKEEEPQAEEPVKEAEAEENIVEEEEPAAEAVTEEAVAEAEPEEPVTEAAEELKDSDPLADLFADIMSAKEDPQTEENISEATKEEAPLKETEPVQVKEPDKSEVDEDLDGLAGLFADFDGENIEEPAEEEFSFEEKPGLREENNDELFSDSDFESIINEASIEQANEAQPVEAQPVEAQPVEAQPVEEQPVEAQPAEEQAVEAQPVEEQPAEEQPVEAQPVEEQPAEEQPVEAQPVEEQPAEEQQAVEAQAVEAQPVETQPNEAEKTAEDEPEEEYDVMQDIGTEIESEESIFVGSGEKEEYVEPEIHEGDELTIKFHDPETGEEIITSTNLDKTQPVRKIEKYALTEELREELAEFLLQEGMEEDICDVITTITALKRSGNETGGNLIVTGDPKSGKSFLAISIIKAVAQDLGNGSGKVAKVQAEAINGKNVSTIFRKIKGNDLLIENIGLLDDETVKQLLTEMKSGRTNDLVVIEGNVLAVETMINNYPEIEDLFKSRIDIQELTISQWADVACDYAAHKGYKMDDMALLALHAKIDQTNQPTSRFGYKDIVQIMEDAMQKSEKRNTGKLFSAFNKKDEGVIELTEADFM